MVDRRHWLVLLLLALCCLRVQAAVDVVDDRGAHVQVARPPLRIVSLSPTLTETVWMPAAAICRQISRAKALTSAQSRWVSRG